MYRQLGANEHLTWLYQQLRPMHFSITASIVGDFLLEELQQAFKKAQQRHPILNVKIVTDKFGVPWFEPDFTPIPIRLVKRHSPTQWQHIVEQEIANPFDWSQAPLVRGVFLCGEYSHELIITCDHTIADGRSAVLLLRDILQTMGQPEQELVALPMQKSYEEILKCGDDRTTFLEPSLSKVETKPRLPEHSRPRLHAWQLPKAETIALINKCKAAQTTVHGAICAAFLLAISDAHVNTLKCLSPVDIRKFLPLGDDFGYYFVAVVTNHDIDLNTSLWDLARSVKSQLDQKTALSEIFSRLPQIEEFILAHPSNEAVVSTMEKFNENDLLVSNLGRLSIPQQYGQLQLEAVYGPVLTGHIDRDLIIGVATLNDQMSFTLVYPKSDISLLEVRQIQEKAMSLLSNS